MTNDCSAADELISSLKVDGITNDDVIEAIAKIPREQFVLKSLVDEAYDNHALPIECGQTISQPYVVARMTQVAYESGQFEKVLEIGTGSGYQAAILSHLANRVYTIERIRALYESAKERLAAYSNIESHYGDGHAGLEQAGPFDAILVTAGASEVPEALLQQLADGGRLVIPVSEGFAQQLQIITKVDNDYTVRVLDPVVFVPLLSGTD